MSAEPTTTAKRRPTGRGGSRLARVLGALAAAAVVSAALPALAGATNFPTTTTVGCLPVQPGSVELKCFASTGASPVNGLGLIGFDAFEDLTSRNRPEAMRIGFSVVGAGTFSHESFCTPEEGVAQESEIRSQTKAECSVNYTPLSLAAQTVVASFSSENVGGIFYEASIGFSQVQAPAVATSAGVTCNPATLTAGTPTTCTIAVAQQSSIPSPPSGTVELKTALDAGFDSGRTCTLVPTGDHSASCGVTLTPLEFRDRPPISAEYAGVPGEFSRSSATRPTFLEVEGRHSQAALHCDRTSIAVGQPTTCTVTVTDSAPLDGIAPEGFVEFTGQVSSRDQKCQLATRATGESSCQITYTPRETGPASISAYFGGSLAYLESTASLDLQVHGPPGSPGTGPLLSKISFAPKRFRVGPKAKRGKKAVGGGVLRLTSNEPATLSISIDSLARGRGHRKPKPKHLVTLGASIAAGANRVPVSGRTGKAQKPLRPGSYRMTVTARNVGGDVSTPVVVPFTILPGHSR